MRTSEVKELRGGASAMFRHWIGLFFRDGADVSKGVLCKSPHGDFMIVARLGGVVADGDATAGIWGAKPASATLPCRKCYNIVAAHHAEDTKGADFLSVAWSDPADFKQHTDESLWRRADELEADVRNAHTKTAVR